MQTVRRRPTFIDLGHAYPNPVRLTLIIRGRDRINFPAAPEQMFHQGQSVCAQGIVTRYRGIAQLEVGVWDPDDRMLT